MKDVYVNTFKTLIREREQESGFAMPRTIEQYCVYLLAERVERTDLIPDPSFGERYLMMFSDPKAAEFKQFADDCLFFTSILPEYGNRRGINMSYYVSLGVSSYHTCGDLTRESIYKQVGDFFDPLRKFLESTIRNRPIESLFLSKLF